MDINESQQVNTFLKGMNTDLSDSLLDTSQYRYAENLRITTNIDSNTGELRLIEGATGYVSICENAEEILHCTKIRNYILVIVKDTDGVKHLYRVNEDTKDNALVYTWTTLSDNISSTCRWEGDGAIFIYIADGERPIQKINITIDNQVESNERNVNIALDKPSAGLSTGGSIHALKAQYTYRIYNKDGETSQLSPFSEIIRIYRTDYNGIYGYKDINTGQSVRLRMSAITNYGQLSMQIYRIGYVENGQLPNIALIYDGKYILDYVDDGSNVSDLAVEEFYSLSNLQIIPAVIEQKDNYLFASNIKDITQTNNELDWFDASKVEVGLTTKTQEFSKLTISSGNYSGGDLSLRRGESYRYGIVFYFTDGTRSSVKHLTDIDIPESQAICNDGVSSAVITGINVKLNQELPNNVAGWEIVRCKRTIQQTKNLTTGIVWRSLHAKSTLSDYPYDVYVSPQYLTMVPISASNDSSAGKGWITAQGDGQLIFFTSPEVIYTPDSTEERLNSYNSQNKLYIRDNYSVPTNVWASSSYGSDYKYIGSSDENPFPLVRGNNSWEMAYTSLFANMNWQNYAFHDQISTGNQRNVFLNNIKPNAKLTDTPNFNGKLYEIDDHKIINSPNPQTLDDGNEEFKFNTDIIPIAGKNVLRWSNFPAAYNLKLDGGWPDRVKDVFKADPDYNDDKVDRFPTSGMGTCLALSFIDGTASLPYNTSTNFIITTASIQKTADSYGPEDRSIYYSYGKYHNGRSAASYTKTIYDGDCFIRSFEYVASHTYDSAVYSKGQPMVTSVYTIPVETDIDILAEYGHSFSYSKAKYVPQYYNIQDKAVTFSAGSYTQSKDCYLYNTTYSQQPNVTFYTSDDSNDITNSVQYDTRTHYSLLKQNGEAIDSWLQFKAANFLDVDTKYGPITDLKTFNNNLIFWQKDAAGVLSVNERTLLQSEDSANVILGNGDVLQRADYITTLYGMQPNQFCSTNSDNNLFWWDSKRRELLQYAGGQQVIPMTKRYGLTNYINERVNIDKPKLAYDHKYTEMLANVVQLSNGTDETLVFNEAINAFSAIYKIAFEGSAKLDDSITLAKTVNNEAILYKWNDSVKTDEYKYSYYGANELRPLLKYVVNRNNTMVKTFDIQTFGAKFYGNANQYSTNNLSKNLVKGEYGNLPLVSLNFEYTTPLNQTSSANGMDIMTNRELDFRLDIPRNGQTSSFDPTKQWGNRMRGKTMQCQLRSSHNSTDFSLQYIITKYRMSWS